MVAVVVVRALVFNAAYARFCSFYGVLKLDSLFEEKYTFGILFNFRVLVLNLNTSNDCDLKQLHK